MQIFTLFPSLGLGWVILSIALGIAGSGREVGGILAFILSMLFSPLFGMIIVFDSNKKRVLKFEEKLLERLESSPMHGIQILEEKFKSGFINEEEYKSILKRMGQQ